MTARVLKPRAELDLARILDHLAVEAGNQIARKYVLAFDACLDRLQQFPSIGAPRPELGDFDQDIDRGALCRRL